MQAPGIRRDCFWASTSRSYGSNQELARFAGGRPLDDDLTLALVRRP
jgi:hypothetical protein